LTYISDIFYRFFSLDGTYHETEGCNDTSLVDYTQRQLENNMNASSGFKK